MEHVKRINEFGLENAADVDLLTEGIVPNYVRKTVKLTMENNNGVDFSEKKYIMYKRNGITVFSIFKRTALPGMFSKNGGRDEDGNPFIWALKGMDGWKFDASDEKLYKYIRRFLDICHSIDKEYDVIVQAPSKNKVNKRFMEIIGNIVRATTKIEDYFLKVKTSEILYNLNTELIEKDYKSDYAKDYLERDMIRMLNGMGSLFEVKKFNKKYLKYINSVVDVNNKYTVADSQKLFEDKRVLVLDDVFSSGKTVSDCVSCIRDFNPQKVDVITLLSARFKK